VTDALLPPVMRKYVPTATPTTPTAKPIVEIVHIPSDLLPNLGPSGSRNSLLLISGSFDGPVFAGQIRAACRRREAQRDDRGVNARGPGARN